MTSPDVRVAAELAERAGELLLELRAGSGLTGKELGRRGDVQSNDLLLRLLAGARPGDAVLSEESADSPARLTADRVWIIDPLDGTREYGMPGRDDWAVHVALWQRGAGVTDAAVAQPALDAVYTSDEPPSSGRFALLAQSEQPDASSPLAQSEQSVLLAQSEQSTALRFLVSASRPPAWATPVAEQLGAGLVPMGSAGAKAMAVLRGEADAYLHDGGQWEWDSAAPVGVVTAHGLHASRIDGSPLVYNEPHPYLPDLLICAPDLAQPLLAAIAAATA